MHFYSYDTERHCGIFNIYDNSAHCYFVYPAPQDQTDPEARNRPLTPFSGGSPGQQHLVLESAAPHHYSEGNATNVPIATAGLPTVVEPQAFVHPTPVTAFQRETRAIPDERCPTTPNKGLPQKGRRRLYGCWYPSCSHLKPMKPSALVQHQYVHTGDKPFSCEFCCRKFPKRGNLTRHYKTCKASLQATSRSPSFPSAC